jgi:hypothetical protein
MALTLRGDGTITGLVPGGLPAACITAANLAQGAVPASNGPAASAWMSTSHTIPNAIAVPAQFQTKEFDTANCFNNTGSTAVLNGITVPAYSFAPNKAGYYLIATAVALISGVNYIMLYKNGAEYKRFISASGSAGVLLQLSGSCLVYLNGVTDYVGVSVYQNTGFSQSTTNLQPHSWFQASFARGA